VSSKRRLQRPPFSLATPKFRQIDLAWPICRKPLGSGGKRVCTRPSCLPLCKSCSIIWRMKFDGAELSEEFMSCCFLTGCKARIIAAPCLSHKRREPLSVRVVCNDSFQDELR